MKVIVTGGRDFHDYEYIRECLDKIHKHMSITELVHGGAKGVDYSCGEWAIDNGITVTVYRANWDELGLSAGPVRNVIMAEENMDAKFLIAFPGGKGTKHMMETALEKGIDIIHVDAPKRKKPKLEFYKAKVGL